MPEMFSSGKGFLCSGWMESGFVVPNDAGSAMTLDLMWEPQIHRPLTVALDCRWKEKRLGMSKVTDCVEGRVPGEADSEKQRVCTEFGSAPRVTTWESKSSTSRGRSSAMQLVPDRCGLSELAWATAKRPELHISRWPVTGQAATRKTAQLRASCLSSIQCNSPVRNEPRHQPPTVPQLGKECRGWCGSSSPAWLATRCAT